MNDSELLTAMLKNTKAHADPFFMAEEVAALFECVGSVLYDGDEYHDFRYASPNDPESVYVNRYRVYVVRPDSPLGQEVTG